MSYTIINLDNNFNHYPYLIVNHETEMFEEILNKYKILPISSISNKQIFLCNEYGIPATYTSDKYGFRNKNSQFINKKKKIIFIGDSFILGFCHDDKDIITNLINNDLKESNIVNLSHGGTGPLLQSAILREYASIFEYEDVYWFYDFYLSLQKR